MGKKVQSYTAEFRAEAVKLVLAQGFSLQGLHSGFQCPRGHWLTGCQSPWSEACRYPWSVVAELEGENKQLRKELAQMRMERDFVKKAATYFNFARESLQGARSCTVDLSNQQIECKPSK